VSEKLTVVYRTLLVQKQEKN